MKILIPILAMLMVGCSIISPPNYHEAEYANLIEIAAEASQGLCSVEQKERLANLALRSALYSKYLPHNEIMAEGTEKMDETIQNLKSMSAPSPAFCQIKLHIIKTMATTLAEAAGGKTK